MQRKDKGGGKKRLSLMKRTPLLNGIHCIYFSEMEGSVSSDLLQGISGTSEAIYLLVGISDKYLSTRLTSDQ